MKQPAAESLSRPPQPFAGEGGVVVVPRNERDPYQVLDDLMTVVEALCPAWPERETFRALTEFLL